MTVKSLRKIIQTAVKYVKQMNIYPVYIAKHNSNHSFNNSKWRRMALPCSE